MECGQHFLRVDRGRSFSTDMLAVLERRCLEGRMHDLGLMLLFPRHISAPLEQTSLDFLDGGGRLYSAVVRTWLCHSPSYVTGLATRQGMVFGRFRCVDSNCRWHFL